MSWSVSGKVNAASAAEDFAKLKDAALSQNAECGDKFEAGEPAVAPIIEAGRGNLAGLSSFSSCGRVGIRAQMGPAVKGVGE